MQQCISFPAASEPRRLHNHRDASEPLPFIAPVPDLGDDDAMLNILGQIDDAHSTSLPAAPSGYHYLSDGSPATCSSALSDSSAPSPTTGTKKKKQAPQPFDSAKDARCGKLEL